MRKLYLFFPQWQGIDRDLGPYLGAQIIKKNLQDSFKFQTVKVSLKKKNKTGHGILAFKEIREQFKKAKEILDKVAAQKVYTLAGDCGADVTPISYLNSKHKKDFALIWIDSHGDLNTPESSPSARFHGMPIRVLLGEGEKSIVKLVNTKLDSRQIFLVGTRDLDPSEVEYIKKGSISVFPFQKSQPHFSSDRGESVVFDLKKLIGQIKKREFKKIYIHFDFDSLNPKVFPWVSVPAEGGLSFNSALMILQELKRNFTTIGAGIFEFNPNVPKTKLAKKLIKKITAIFCLLQKD